MMQEQAPLEGAGLYEKNSMENVANDQYKGTKNFPKFATPAFEKSAFDRLLEFVEPKTVYKVGNFKNHDVYVLLADEISELCLKNNIHIVYAPDLGLMSYDDQKWVSVKDDEAKNRLGLYAEKAGVDSMKSKNYRFRDEFLLQIKSTLYEDWLMPAEAAKINLLNGTLDIATQTLLPHDPADRFRYVLPYSFNPEAQCPKFRKFLNEVLEPDAQEVLKQYFAYVLLARLKILKLEKCLVLFGNGANGKSVVLEVLSAAIGHENIASISFAALCRENSPYLASLNGKLLCVCTDAEAKIDNSAILKRIISHEPICCRLLYSNPIEMTEYASLVCALNELPTANDTSAGFFRRFIILPFSKEIPEEEQDKTLATTIIGEELPGVLNWILEGAAPILENQRFSYCESAERQLLQYRKSQDNVSQFISDMGYTTGRSSSKPLADAYQHYKQYCTDNGYCPCSNRKFADRLRALKFDVSRGAANVVTFFFDQPTDSDMPF